MDRTVKQYKPLRSGPGQSLRHLRRSREDRVHLDTDGYGNIGLDGAQCIDIELFDRSCIDIGVGRYIGDIELKRVGTGLFEFFGIIDPAPF